MYLRINNDEVLDIVDDVDIQEERLDHAARDGTGENEGGSSSRYDKSKVVAKWR